VDIHLFCRHDHFTDQTVSDGLALFKRQPVQIVPQQSSKGFGMVDDLLPMPRLMLRAS
jgi:hypothetical protein